MQCFRVGAQASRNSQPASPAPLISVKWVPGVCGRPRGCFPAPGWTSPAAVLGRSPMRFGCARFSPLHERNRAPTPLASLRVRGCFLRAPRRLVQRQLSLFAAASCQQAAVYSPSSLLVGVCESRLLHIFTDSWNC